MRPVFKLLLPLGLIALLFSCKKDELQLPAQSNELYRFGFDDDNDTSFENWTSDYFGFSHDVPPGGGTWSLTLFPKWSPMEGLAETAVNLTSAGSFDLRLSADTKTTDAGKGWLRLLLQHSDGSRDMLTSASFTNSDWQNISVTASADIASGDKIIIQLSAGGSQVATWDAFFDNVELVKQ